MKKTITFIFALMMLSIANVSAQSLAGEWIADEAFNKELNAAYTEKGISLSFGLDITEKTITCQLFEKVVDGATTFDVAITFPGTYTRKGKKVNATFYVERSDFRVTNITSTNPDVKAGMAIDEMKEVFMRKMTEMLKEQQGDNPQKLGTALTGIFKEFTIKQLTESELSLFVEKGNRSQTFHFNR